jgi:glycosyltransferase involved in cell wall biosynthesis
LFKRLGWHKKVRFHATDEEESRFIVDCFGPQTRVFVAPNVPRKIGGLPLRSKEPGQLTLLSIALVSPMKNFDLVLRALLEVKGAVTYHIYGPVIDPDYWKECTAIIEKLPPAVQVYYHGELQPSKVPEALSDTHVFILPSKSENFGHAIFESLSAGKPVVTSYNTPWKDLCRLKAGWNVATEVQAVSALLNRLVEMGPEEYAAYCAGAGRVAELYLEQADFSLLYRRLFEGGS